jgi:hypothetical protein
MEKSSQIAWKTVPLRHFFPLKVVPLIEVLLYRIDEVAWGKTRRPIIRFECVVGPHGIQGP